MSFFKKGKVKVYEKRNCEIDMSKSSSSTQRDERQQEKQEKQYQALVEQVLTQAPTSYCENFVCARILLVIHIIFKNTLSHLSKENQEMAIIMSYIAYC